MNAGVIHESAGMETSIAGTIGILDTREGQGFRESWFAEGVTDAGEFICEDAPVAGRKFTTAEGRPALLARRTDGATGPVSFTVRGVEFALGTESTEPLLVDLATGEIFDVDPLCVKSTRNFWSDNINCRTRFHNLPLGPDEMLISCRVDTPIAFDWHKMKPAEIVDCLYRPGMWRNKTPPAKASWMEMETDKFIPFIDRYGQFKYREWPGKTHCDADLKAAAASEEKDLSANPGPSGRDRFGGWSEGPKFEATGRFYPLKHEGKWWLVDPEGNLFWSFGAIRVTPSSAMTPLNGQPHCSWSYGRKMPPRHSFFEELPEKGGEFAKFYETHDELLIEAYLKRGETEWYDFSSANLYRKYGADYYARFSDLCHRRLRSWGMNTIANSSDTAICLQDRTPYAERVECISRFIEGAPEFWWKFRDPFDPSFTEGVTTALASHGREAHDPWCIGFFVDNEIVWGDGETDLARWILNSPVDQPARKEFRQFLEGRGKREEDVDFSDLRDFTGVVINEYFKKTREAVKSFDPGLLYLGCRFAGAPQRVVEICSRYVDIISYNIYTYSLRDWKLPADIDLPVLISEFHFGAIDRGPFGRSLMECASQDDRAEKLVAFVRDALANRLIAGVHWHQFSDQATTGRFDGEYFQVGLTDICDTPYPETVAALREVGSDMYQTRFGK